MLIAWLSLLITLAGLFLYLLSSNPKGAEIGRLMFFAGMLASTLQAATKVLRIG